GERRRLAVWRSVEEGFYPGAGSLQGESRKTRPGKASAAGHRPRAAVPIPIAWRRQRGENPLTGPAACPTRAGRRRSHVRSGGEIPGRLAEAGGGQTEGRGAGPGHHRDQPETLRRRLEERAPARLAPRRAPLRPQPLAVGRTARPGPDRL